MINKLLHALANRSGPFQDPSFIGDPGFKPAVIGEQEQKLRKLMLLDVTDTDYYLKAYLSVLEAYPDIKALASDTVVSYSVLDTPPRGVEINGGEFYSAINSSSYFSDVPSDILPVTLTYQITFVDSHNLKISGMETGLIRMTTYQKSGVDPNAVLRIEWPEDIPFHGLLTLSQTWLKGAMVQISVTPSAFPYTQLAARITGNPCLTRFLVHSQFVDEYVSIPDAQRRVAVAAIVLALSNPSVYPV